MRTAMIRTLILATTTLCLAACGGGGGGSGSGFASTPPPPPPPPAFTPVKIFPSITASTEFAALGLELSANPAVPTSDGFSVRYDAASDLYIFDLPSHNPGGFHSTSSTDSYWGGGLPAGSILWPPMSVLKPTATNPLIQLNYTSFASYMRAGPMEDQQHGFVAFGVPTAASAIPTTGSATMNAIVAGMSSNGVDAIGGTATLQFDFGAGTLAGHLDPVLHIYFGSSHPLGQYTFTNTVFGAGSTTFSGNFAHANPLLTGAFNGLFTGPNAEELMAKWTADYFVQGVTAQPEKMFGIWVGKKP